MKKKSWPKPGIRLWGLFGVLPKKQERRAKTEGGLVIIPGFFSGTNCFGLSKNDWSSNIYYRKIKAPSK